MPDCAVLEKCIFFNDMMVNMPSTSNVFKLLYCHDKYSDCARYIVRTELGKDGVPMDLFPNQADRAQVLTGKK
jgi:hypothetical protein